MSDTAAGRISRLVLMKALPAVLTDDLEAFGEAITEIQALMGQQFAAYQAGPYSSELGQAVAEFARQQGAAGVGQSSWGPTVFALVRGPHAARELIARIRARVGDLPIALSHTRARQRGAVVRVMGDAGHLLGAGYRGSEKGMRGGAILVTGNAGNETGCAMRRGVIAVGGKAGDFTGVMMIAGTIVVLGELGIRTAAAMKRG